MILPCELNENRKLRKRKKQNNSLTCIVCGSSANGYNFGAIVCESCKAFFRRHARKKSNSFQCSREKNCSITIETRRDCPACRLSKCFNKGMKCDRLSTIEEKQIKRNQLEENRLLTLNSRNPVQLFQSINTNNFFINLFHFQFNQSEQILLNSEDIQRIEQISFFYQNRIEDANREGLPWNPSIDTKSHLDVLNSYSVSIMRLLSFFKQIPEFNQLNVDDKVYLIKYNIITILGINYSLSFNIERKEILENNNDLPMNIQYFQVLHGYDLSKRSYKIFQSFINIAKYDEKIFELILIIILLTKFNLITNENNQIYFHNDLLIYHLQKSFIDLLWKYMQSKYGFQKSFQLFTQFIFNFLSWQIIQENMRLNILQTLSPDDINHLLPIMKSVLRIS
ncbi:unnamed protein product [Adineta ricciae]|uniref:Nuclear receptor n=1 Tax=Adineta ricciae TaxID=249248 RepID=A0A815U6P1_ADIRI|nr:unnamed protein product [Adineta ricciae]